MFCLGKREFKSRLLLGSARYPSPAQIGESIRASGAEIVTVSLRRQMRASTEGGFWELLRAMPITFLPNTAGCRSPVEAIATAELARELFETDWIKLEVIGDEQTLRPDPFGLVEAAEELVKRGFFVLPYTTEDPILAERLLGAGCRVLMPWGSPIGTARGLSNRSGLRFLRKRFPELTLIVDAGLGRPSHAADALELGMDAVLVNTAIARADQPARMASAFALAIQAGREAYEAGLVEPRENAEPSTPQLGMPFWKGTIA